MKASKEKDNIKCSFCGRDKQDTAVLIAGINGHICDRCIAQAYQIVNEEFASKQDKTLNQSLNVLKPVEIRTFLNDFVIGQDQAKKVLAVAVYNHFKRLVQKPDEEDADVEVENEPLDLDVNKFLSKKKSEVTKADSYNNYPQSATNNAKRMIEWREKYGRDVVTAGTEVGWRRASQLANRESISLDVVKRMAQFNRHRENAKIDPKFKDTPWKDNGYVAWNLWGGTAGVDWAIREVNKLKED